MPSDRAEVTDRVTLGERIGRRFGYIKLDRIRMSDLATVGHRFGIRFRFRVTPCWTGPWMRADDGHWHRMRQMSTGAEEFVKGPAFRGK